MDPKTLAAIGLFISSGAYLGGCIAAGLVVGNPLAWKLALLGAGLSYFTYASQLVPSQPVAQVTLMWLSILTGAAAGVVLLFDIRWPS